MLERTALRISAWLVCLVAFPVCVRAAAVSIPGTSVSIDAPPGFTVSKSFSGLEKLDDGSSVLVAELPAGAYEQLSALFADLDAATAGFAQKGVRVERRESWSAGDAQVPVLIGTQQSGGVEVGKVFALYRGEMTVLVTVNVMDAEATTPAAVKAALESVRTSAAPTLEEQIERLPFTFQAVAPFRSISTIAGSGVLLATSEGSDPTMTKPAMVIASSLSPVDTSVGLEQLARRMLAGTTGFEDAEVTVTEEKAFDDAPVHYLEAVSGERRVVQFVKPLPDGGYLRILAFGETSALEGVMPAVEEIARSVSMRQ